MKENKYSWANSKDSPTVIIFTTAITAGSIVAGIIVWIYNSAIIPPKIDQITQLKEIKSDLTQQNLELKKRTIELEKQVLSLKKEVLAQASPDKKYSDYLEKSNLVLKPIFLEEGTKLSILKGQVLLKVELINASNKTVILQFYDNNNEVTQLLSKFRDRNIVVLNGKKYMIDVFDFEESQFHLDDKVQISIYAASEDTE